jgi:hypothetical protein
MEIKILQAVETGFFQDAVESLGVGYVRDYYDQNFVTYLHRAYRQAFEDGTKSSPKTKGKK